MMTIKTSQTPINNPNVFILVNSHLDLLRDLRFLRGLKNIVYSYSNTYIDMIHGNANRNTYGTNIFALSIKSQKNKNAYFCN